MWRYDQEDWFKAYGRNAPKVMLKVDAKLKDDAEFIGGGSDVDVSAVGC